MRCRSASRDARTPDVNAADDLALRGRYHEILGYRTEGLRKYGGRVTSDIFGPRWRVSLPTIGTREPVVPSVRMGPLFFGDNPPVLTLLRDHLDKRDGRVAILEIGPGKGSAAAALRARYGDRISRYDGIERDENVSGPYHRIASVHDVAPGIDLVIASHVIEHMPSEMFFDDVLRPLMRALNRDATIVVATPNALSPTAIFGDFTHVQGYAWYDLYALLRLYFERVDVVRARYLWSPSRLAWLLPRVALTRALELDWCDELICVASGPRMREETPAGH